MSRHDKQLVRLTETPRQISHEWSHGMGFFGGVGISDLHSSMADNPYICLTRMKLHLFNNKPVYLIVKGKPDMELTEELRNDNRIPRNGASVNSDNLKYFKEWWEKLDKLNGTE